MRWLIAAVVLLAVAWVLNAGLVLYAGATLAVVAAVGRWLSHEGLTRVNATRRVSADQVEVGETVEVRLTVVNSGRRPVIWLLLEDLLPVELLTRPPARLAVKGRRLRVRSLRAGSETVVTYDISYRYRGVYVVGPMVLESGDLFGFHRRYKVVAPPAVVTVLPRVVPLAGFDIASRRPIGDVRLSHRLYEDPTRIAGVRPYQPGDPLNRIHWRATARTGRFHSKVYEPSTLAGATLLVDFHDSGYPVRGEPHRSDLVTTTAASLAHAILQINQQVGLWSNGADGTRRWVAETWSRIRRTDRVDDAQFDLAELVRRDAEPQAKASPADLIGVPTGRGWAQLPPILLALARLEPDAERTFAAFLAEVAPRLPRDATALAVMTAVSEESAFALGNLRRQGFAVAAVLVMPAEDALNEALGRLAAHGVRDVRVLEDQTQLPDLCAAQVRPAAMALAN